MSQASLDDLQAIDGVGTVVAESITAWFVSEDNTQLLEKFKQLGVKPQYERRGDGPLQGKRFVVTGSLEAMSRDAAADQIRALGGTFQSALGKDTDYLVVGNNVGASKLAKASKYGTKQLTEAELLKLFK